MKRLGRSFRFAFAGLFNAMVNETNFRIHLVAMATVAYFAAVYGVEKWEAASLAIVISMVLALELLNTAIEMAVDVATPDWNPLAKIAKDSAAAAVLVLALGAVAVAVIVFSESEGWIRVLEYIKSKYLWVILFALAGAGFIFCNANDKEKNR